jgi:hypothetical protein
MPTLTDTAEFTANEIYEIQQTDSVEGAATGASFGGIGLSNQPHQQLANRTAFLKGRQDTNIGNIAALQAFIAGFAGSLQTNGYMKIPIADVERGSVIAIVQWGFYSLAQVRIKQDTQYGVFWPIPFPTAILIPPFASNLYYATGGGNLVVSPIMYSKTSATFVLDVPGSAINGAGLTIGPETTNGFAWLAIGF